MNKVCDDLINFIKSHRNNSLDKIQTKLDEVTVIYDERLMRDLTGFATFSGQRTMIVHEIEQELGLKKIYNEDFSPFNGDLEMKMKTEQKINMFDDGMNEVKPVSNTSKNSIF